MNFLQADSLSACRSISLRSLTALFTIPTIARAVKRDASMGTGNRLGRRRHRENRIGRENLAKLPHDAHFSGGFLADANWLGSIFKFPPASFPVNHRHETVERRRNGFGRTVFHPHTEPCRMFTFTGAGGWSPHSFAPWALSVNISLRALPIGYIRAVSQQTGIWRSLGWKGRNWDSKCVVKMAPELANRISTVESI